MPPCTARTRGRLAYCQGGVVRLLRCVYNKGVIRRFGFLCTATLWLQAFNPKTCWKGSPMVWRTHFSEVMSVEWGNVIMSFHDPVLRHVSIVLSVKQTAFIP